MASTQCRIIGTLTASHERFGLPDTCPTSAASSAEWSGNVGQLLETPAGPLAAHRAHRAPVMPNPAVATISRCTSLTPPPNVLIWAWRCDDSIRPRNNAPGEPGVR